MRVYHTSRPEQQATEFTIAPSGITEAITKLAWMPDENLVVIGQRSGKVQLWDVRTQSGPAISTVISKGGAVIQDLEINPVLNTILLATDDRVRCIPTTANCYFIMLVIRSNLTNRHYYKFAGYISEYDGSFHDKAVHYAHSNALQRGRRSISKS